MSDKQARMELALGGSASVDRRQTAGQQSFRIRKFSRNGSLSRRSSRSLSQKDPGEAVGGFIGTTELTDLKKTIDSEDEDGIVQMRERSRAAGKRRDESEAKEKIKLLDVNVDLGNKTQKQAQKVNQEVIPNIARVGDASTTSKDDKDR